MYSPSIQCNFNPEISCRIAGWGGGGGGEEEGEEEGDRNTGGRVRGIESMYSRPVQVEASEWQK